MRLLRQPQQVTRVFQYSGDGWRFTWKRTLQIKWKMGLIRLGLGLAGQADLVGKLVRGIAGVIWLITRDVNILGPNP